MSKEPNKNYPSDNNRRECFFIKENNVQLNSQQFQDNDSGEYNQLQDQLNSMKHDHAYGKTT